MFKILSVNSDYRSHSIHTSPLKIHSAFNYKELFTYHKNTLHLSKSMPNLQVLKKITDKESLFAQKMHLWCSFLDASYDKIALAAMEAIVNKQIDDFNTLSPIKYIITQSELLNIFVNTKGIPQINIKNLEALGLIKHIKNSDPKQYEVTALNSRLKNIKTDKELEFFNKLNKLLQEFVHSKLYFFQDIQKDASYLRIYTKDSLDAFLFNNFKSYLNPNKVLPVDAFSRNNFPPALWVQIIASHMTYKEPIDTLKQKILKTFKSFFITDPQSILVSLNKKEIIDIYTTTNTMLSTGALEEYFSNICQFFIKENPLHLHLFNADLITLIIKNKKLFPPLINFSRVASLIKEIEQNNKNIKELYEPENLKKICIHAFQEAIFFLHNREIKQKPQLKR